jgi:flagellar basal body-associated protein FliL
MEQEINQQQMGKTQQEVSLPSTDNQEPKKSFAWIWILVFVVLIGMGIGAYFLLSGGDGISSIVGGSSIPSPPALPS